MATSLSPADSTDAHQDHRESGRISAMRAMGPDERHGAVFNPATLQLGEIHWYVLKAANLMNSETKLTRRANPDGNDAKGFTIVRYEQTDFGKEVGRDEINWWVFKKEEQVEELGARSDNALSAAQSLKEAATKLKDNRPESYPELIASLRQFAEEHAAAIDQLRKYVLWLNSRDIRAPKILYTYRVWGSTRMGDRWVDLDAKKFEEETPATIRHLTEIVLGLVSSHLYAIDKAEYEIGEEIWSSMDPEEGSGTEITIPMARVVRRASRMIFDECATYFTCVRDSLRNILLDIDKFFELRNLVNSDAFWQAFVDKAARSPKAETQLWDFKETLTMWRAENGPERERAKITFSEDIASFANARGGVLIIGITDAREVVGVADNHRELENRLKFANDVLAKHLEYGREIFRFRQIFLHDSRGVDKTCLVVIVAQACEAVGVTDGEGRYTYPVRRESGISRVSRDDLMKPKFHMKSDNYDFLTDLNQFIREG